MVVSSPNPITRLNSIASPCVANDVCTEASADSPSSWSMVYELPPPAMMKLCMKWLLALTMDTPSMPSFCSRVNPSTTPLRVKYG